MLNGQQNSTSSTKEYPIRIPEINIQPNLDMLVIELPARYLPLMPNGMGYVYEILKQCNIKYQMIDYNIIVYHLYHRSKHYGITPVKGLPEEFLRDPWDNTNINEWNNKEVVDAFWNYMETLFKKIEKSPPSILGLSIHATNRVVSNRFIKEVRERMKDVCVIVGGYDCFYPDIGPKLIPDFDYMVIGEAELTLPPLVNALMKGQRPANLKGIISRYDTTERKAVEVPRPYDLDSLGYPKYEWSDLSLYYTHDGNHLVPIVTSRGCMWGRCRFCSEILPFRKRSPESVVDEIEFFVSKGFEIFHFNDSDVNSDPENLYHICKEIIRRGLKIKAMGQLRIDKRNDAEYFRLLAQAGFVHLRFGVDGWNDHVLKLQRKGYNMKLVFQNLRDCHNAGIWTTVNIVIGVPGETEQDIDEMVENISRCKNYIDLVESINILILGAGSEYYKYPEKYGIKFNGDKKELYEKYPYYIPSELWYSENPYIDHSVRVKRLDRICVGLYRNGVNIGGFAARAVEALKKSDDEYMERIYGVYDGNKKAEHKPAEKICSLNSSKQPVLVEEGHYGFNIICYDDRYYAIPQGEGEFSIERIESKDGYSKAFAGDRLNDVKDSIEAYTQKSAESAQVACSVEDDKQPLLVEEGHNGFNIIRCDNKFYAIPQGEGEFSMERIEKRDYTKVFMNDTLNELKDRIEEYTSATKEHKVKRLVKRIVKTVKQVASHEMAQKEHSVATEPTTDSDREKLTPDSSEDMEEKEAEQLQKEGAKYFATDPWKRQLPFEKKIVLRTLAESCARRGCRFLEIGSWCGDSAVVLGKVAKKNQGVLFCVDWWRGNSGTELEKVAQKVDVFQHFWERIKKEGLEDVVIPVRGHSDTVSQVLKENCFDLVFIDGDHRYEQVFRDIQQYAPLVRTGGILCGHDCEGRLSDYDMEFLLKGRDVDFYETVHCGVVLAVGRSFKEYSINHSVWSVRKSATERWLPTELAFPEIKDKRQAPVPPVKVVGRHRVFRYGRELYAVGPEVEEFDVTEENERSRPEVVKAKDWQELKALLKMTDEEFEKSATEIPRLVESYRGYNLVHYKNRVYAILQALGRMDLTLESVESIEKHARTGNIIIADSCEEAKATIDELLSRKERATEGQA